MCSYVVPRFYPSYYDEPRPAPTGIPTSISYGGKYFDLTLPADSLNGTDLSTVKVALIRTGYSTHAMCAPKSQLFRVEHC